MTHYDKMTKTPLTKLIISLGIPTTISMLVTNIYNMADTYFVGTLGESAQASIGILFTLQAIIQAVAFMFGQGAGAMISKGLAEQDVDEASMYASSGFFTSVSIGIVFMILGISFLNPFLYLLGSTDTILPFARQYGLCVLISCPAVMGSFSLNNGLRFEGKSFYAMIGLVSGGFINIFGDYLLVMVLKLGVMGAGIATAVSQFISFLILLYFFNKKSQSKLNIKYMSRKISVYLTICKVGLPSLIRQGLSSISSGLLNNLTRPYGDAAIAAMSVVNRFSAFVMCVGLGIGQGYQPVAAFNYQAKEYKRVKKGLLITMAIGFCCISCLSVPGIIFAEEIIYMFQKSKSVIEIGVPALRYACFGVIFLSLSVPVNMLYQSIRRSVVSSFLSLMRSGIMFIPTLLITTKLFKITGIQISQPLADVLTGLMSIPFIIAFLKKKNHNVL